MGKRPPVVVVSSSSEEDESRGRRAASRGPSVRRRRTPATAPSPALEPSGSRKRPRREGSSGRGRRRALEPAPSCSLKAEFDMLSEDFSECLNDLGMSGSLQKTKELWVDKYRPHSSAELAVHTKKVEDVKQWLETKLKTPEQTVGGWTLVLTGQTGVGKSATVKAIAADIGVDICEWTTPVPTLWSEHVHANSGLRYISKLEEFENFVEKIRKYSLLCPTSARSQGKLAIILIDDIPVTSGSVAFARLAKCLTGLTRSTQVPTVISLTHYHKSESNDAATWNSNDLESLLQDAGAYKISFNPVTTNSIKKILIRICKEETCDASEEIVHQIATSSGASATRASSKSRDSLVPGQGNDSLSRPLPSLFGRDETLTLFHALGKFLHNKRETYGDADIDRDPFPLKENLRRNLLKMDVPEKILSQAHGKVRTVADFLYENVLDFIDDEAVDDAWTVVSYLSDADCLLAGSPIASYNSENMAQLIAASVAARGVLFGNAHVAASRWHTIRSPKIWQTEQSLRSTKDQILKERFECSSTSGTCNFSDIVTEFRPFERWIGPRNDRPSSCSLPRSIEGGSYWIGRLDAGGASSEEDDDLIEDC
ncbi:hypothetical protein QOZ80_3AG0240540 [Eleusine coracana subsp. coracana]|nr:hypothetical protein QOZ80_3AG0240540 [Eleusine coracana subsp. coracana]